MKGLQMQVLDPEKAAASGELNNSTRRPARTGIVIDASCDVAPAFLASADVAVIPIPIRIGTTTYIDQHDATATARYLRENANGEGATGQSLPLDAAQMSSLFLEHFALDYDSVYCLTITASRSPIYEAASQGSLLATNAIREARQENGIARPFQFRVIDTRNMFAGSGIPAMVLQDLLRAQVPAKDIRGELQRIIDATHTYYVPDNLGYARARSRVRGDRSISLVSVLLGGALDIKPIVLGRQGDTRPVAKCRGRDDAWTRLFAFAATRVRDGLHAPHVIVSYAGPLQDLHGSPALDQLRTACEQENVSLHILPMSITGMMNIGPGGLTLAFASETNDTAF
ncbi:DegV family protein [Stenotrophomonas humi]|uniref:DegV family protein n=1 Tax=Stenotrophomonas humi TaxID=405444 RepID=UPI001FE0080D|nr:DegV family protein [Stenotrophomonas humi]